ncbi:hypothetical protein QE152_g29104 [Popillia japonica]|uniref:Uncharacterized protein n=1 Tax=Popillia japonica TaxID=7064 RepID=A0AAW1JHZ8_POPJA
MNTYLPPFPVSTIMYRTPPKPDTPYAKTPLPNSPATKNKNMTLANNQAITNNRNNETLTPRDSHNFSGIDDLSDEEIMKQIKNLRNNETLTPRDSHNFSGIDDLSDEEIMKQIKNLGIMRRLLLAIPTTSRGLTIFQTRRL